ncbi:hypothetical protein F7R23_13465 [Burkholderia diffusa]|nr:hypothetical protein F7R23_13465 [Burkholderia diffusa]
MHVAWMQCSENPPLAYGAFVANCNSTRRRRPCSRAPRPGNPPRESRDSVRAAKPRRAGRSVLPDPVSAAGTLP